MMVVNNQVGTHFPINKTIDFILKSSLQRRVKTGSLFLQVFSDTTLFIGVEDEKWRALYTLSLLRQVQLNHCQYRIIFL